MATASVEVYLFTPAFLTLTLFQGHWDTRGVKLQLKNGGGGGRGHIKFLYDDVYGYCTYGKIKHTERFVFAFWIW